METKTLEIRDSATCISALAIRMQSSDPVRAYYIHYRCGYPRDGSAIVLMKLSTQDSKVDPYDWGGRTMPVAHNYIYDNFDKLKDGDVVDVRVLLGETKEPVISERLDQQY